MFLSFIFCGLLFCTCNCDSSFFQNCNDHCFESQKNEIVALVLARGGSKGIPLKNLAQIGNETLLSRSLKIIKRSEIFKEIWVSTDSFLIELDAKGVGGVFVHRRSKYVAKDTTSSIESVQEFLFHHPEIENLALIQCTSVFLKESYLKKGADLFQSSDCVFSITRSYKLRWKLENGRLFPVNFNPSLRPRRQDWDGDLLETGMFYFTRRTLLETGVLQSNSCKFVEIATKDSLEIDDKTDLDLARCLMAL